MTPAFRTWSPSRNGSQDRLERLAAFMNTAQVPLIQQGGPAVYPNLWKLLPWFYPFTSQKNKTMTFQQTTLPFIYNIQKKTRYRPSNKPLITAVMAFPPDENVIKYVYIYIHMMIYTYTHT
jgi:hypothetical protein